MKARKCEDADELVALAETCGYEITKEEAEAYSEEMDDCEMDVKLFFTIKLWNRLRGSKADL